VSFFDDDAEVTQVPAPAGTRPRRSRNRSRLRIQRLVLALVVLFIVVFAIALVFRSCQQNAKESAYRTYFTQIATDVTDSNKVGKQLGTVIADPTRPNNLKATLDSLASQQAEITKRAENTKPPGKLKALHQVFVDGMKVRLSGVQQMRDGLTAATNPKNHVTARKLAALSGYFTGPDAYYNELYYTQAQQIMKQDGVTGVGVPAMNYFSSHDLFSQSAIAAALGRVGSSAKLTGTHGVGLAGVAVKSNGVTTVLVTGKDNRFKASPGMVIEVTVQNQGTATETNVSVKVTWTPPDNSAPQTVTATIDTLAPNQKKTVDVQGLTIGATAIGKPSHLKVQAGPVPGEKYLQNNSTTYSITPGLSG